jgi:DNA-directed RNA polymerase subunit RPC12/RpoP
MVVRAVKILVYLLSAVLVFFGLIFMISVNLGAIYFFEGLIFIVVAGVLLFSIRERKPVEIRQTVTVTGPVKAVQVRCPNCGANVDPMKAQVIDGKPYVTCDHCGNRFELSEEPTW